jgi:hypothetical protein
MKLAINKNNLFLFLSLIVVTDQMLLPMFHPFNISFKPSYLILLAVPFIIMFDKKDKDTLDIKKRFWYMTSPVMVIAIMGCLGQLFLTTQGNVIDPEAFPIQIISYILIVLAFYFGQRVSHFKSNYLLFLLYGQIALILLLIFFPEKVPFLTEMWWKTEEASIDRMIQVQGRAMPFGDGTMVAVGVIFLFITISARLGYLHMSFIQSILCIVLSLGTTFITASRNQMVAIGILSILLIIKDSKHIMRHLLTLSVILIIFTITVLSIGDSFKDEFKFINYAFTRFENMDLLDVENSGEDTVLRPLARWDRFFNRFRTSPFFGTGFSLLPYEPFHRLNFHNDWFHIWATSGAIGGIFFFLWMYRIYRTLGLIILMPFFLPGLTNSFILALNSVIFYSFMLGVLMEKGLNTNQYLSYPKGLSCQ